MELLMKKSNVKRFEKGGYNVGTYNTRPTPEQQNKERSRRERERNIALDKADAIEEVGSPLDLIAPGANLGRRVAGKLVDKALSKATPKSFKEGMDALYHARRPGRMVPKSKTQLQELMGQRTPRDRLSTDEAAKSHGVDGDATYWGDQFKKGGKVKKMADGGMTGFRAATPKPEPRPPIPVAPTITPKQWVDTVRLGTNQFSRRVRPFLLRRQLRQNPIWASCRDTTECLLRLQPQLRLRVRARPL